VVNTIAIAAFGFSMWISTASLVVVASGNDFVGSIMIYVFVAFLGVICLLIRLRLVALATVVRIVDLRQLMSENMSIRYTSRAVWCLGISFASVAILWSTAKSKAESGLVALCATSITALSAALIFTMLATKRAHEPNRVQQGPHKEKREWQRDESKECAAVFQKLCFALYLISNCLALFFMSTEDYSSIWGRKTGVILVYAVLVNDFAALFTLTCWYWCSLGGLAWLADALSCARTTSAVEVIQGHQENRDNPMHSGSKSSPGEPKQNSAETKERLVQAFQRKVDSERGRNISNETPRFRQYFPKLFRGDVVSIELDMQDLEQEQEGAVSKDLGNNSNFSQVFSFLFFWVK
jgi:hypothetical protein